MARSAGEPSTRWVFARRRWVAGLLVQRNGQASALAVIFLDLDDFKAINDSLGHAHGDDVLAAVAGRLASVMRDSDTAARFRGDEFVLLLEDVVDVDDARLVAERLVTAVSQPFHLGGADVRPRASVGIAIGMPGVSTAEELLRNSDVAMYAVKSLRRGGVLLGQSAASPNSCMG